MLTRKTLVILAGLLTIAAVMILMSWAPATVTAQGPAATPPPAPVAVLESVSVPANAALPGAITTTIKYITDTAVGEKSGVVALGTTGLQNVPVGVPVRFQVSAANPKNTGKPTWNLMKPAASKAALKDPAATVAEFTPDVPGWYRVDVVLKNEAGQSSAMKAAQVHADTYVGVEAGNCKQCHATKVAEWAKTGHAEILKFNIDAKPSHYSETCIRCHTTGYFPAPFTGSGGFADVAAKLNWKLPTFAQIEKGGNWDALPAELKNMGNIQCEQCHGPAGEHVKTGAATMATSSANGSCDVCHAGGGHHIKGLEILSSKHSDEEGAAWNSPVGDSRQACVRCHSGEGFVSFLKDPKNQAAWVNVKETVGCATCHDPHDEKNAFQLRIVGKPVEITFDAKNVGLSAVCYECHNARTKPEDAAKGSTPHYSSAAELLSDLGGVTYGQTVPNSPHGMMVGAAPVANPAAASDPAAAKWLFTAADAKEGNVPGPCVVCHMTAGLADAKDPNAMKVGEHSFNTSSPDGKFDYGASCKSCHGDVKDFNLKAKADYDGNGKVEGVQDEVKGLLNVLWKELEAKGLKKVATGHPYATLPQGADAKINNAWFNYRTVYGVMWGAETGDGNQGMGSAIHNFKRSVALLQLSYKDLTGNDVAGATLMK